MGRPGQNAETRSNLSKNRGIWLLPYSELMDRKAKGICFRCGEHFHPLHQCEEKQIRLVILGDDETINEEGEVLAIELKEEEEIALECNALGVFGVTIVKDSWKPSTTMRLEGTMMGIGVQILADSGASHCFIDPKVTATLGLVVEPNTMLGVKLGDGHRVNTVGKCRNIELHIGDFTTRLTAYVLELGDLDLILGATWMRQFGKVTFDWENMVLSFPWKEGVVELQG